MLVRRLTVAALALLLPMTAAACGGDEKKADSAASTTAAETATTAAPADGGDTAPGEPTTTMSPVDFDEAIATFGNKLDDAGDDFCEITSATDALTISEATSPEQAKQLYQAFADVLNAVADHLPAGSGADADTLKGAAERIMSDAEADGYNPATMSAGPPDVFNDPEVMKSMTAVNEDITKNCPQG